MAGRWHTHEDQVTKWGARQVAPPEGVDQGLKL